MINVWRNAISNIISVDYAAIRPDFAGQIIVGDQVVNEPFKDGWKGRNKSALSRTGSVEIEKSTVHDGLSLISLRSCARRSQIRWLLQITISASLALRLHKCDQFIFELRADDFLMADETLQHIDFAVHQRESRPRCRWRWTNVDPSPFRHDLWRVDVRGGEDGLTDRFRASSVSSRFSTIAKGGGLQVLQFSFFLFLFLLLSQMITRATQYIESCRILSFSF
jgi:hypothetical protein